MTKLWTGMMVRAKQNSNIFSKFIMNFIEVLLRKEVTGRNKNDYFFRNLVFGLVSVGIKIISY